MNPQNFLTKAHHVYVVDDDLAVRTALGRALTQLGYDVHSFSDGATFLSGAHIFRPSVLVIDMQLPGITGVEVQDQLTSKGWEIPVVFISGESSVAQGVMAMKQGALEFLSKPFDLIRLAAVVELGIEQDKSRLEAMARRRDCERQLTVLSPRERETFFWLAKGYAYRELMQAMEISLPTAKQYRAAVMRKLGLASLAGLIEFHGYLDAGQR